MWNMCRFAYAHKCMNSHIVLLPTLIFSIKQENHTNPYFYESWCKATKFEKRATVQSHGTMCMCGCAYNTQMHVCTREQKNVRWSMLSSPTLELTIGVELKRPSNPLLTGIVNNSFLPWETIAFEAIASDFFSSFPVGKSTVLDCSRAVNRSISDLWEN